MATIKKAQRGIAIDKTATKKPKGTVVIKNKPKGTYMDAFSRKATKKDSTDYTKGYDYGKDKPKNTLQGIVQNPRWNAGNLEGRDDKRPMKKIKLKTGGTIKKAQLGGKFSDIHSGSAKTHPGVIKAKADKVKVNNNVKAYKTKASATNKVAISSAKKKATSKK